MSVVDKISDAIKPGEIAYDYGCTDCGATFESGHSRLAAVSCPACASTRIERA